jgi:hypothetical protein
MSVAEAAQGGGKMLHRVLCWLLIVFIGLSFVNFRAFGQMSRTIGGDAMNGYAAGGHYFVNSHGRYTEVSEAVYNYNWWHALSIMISIPLAMLAGYIFIRLNRKSS